MFCRVLKPVKIALMGTALCLSPLVSAYDPSRSDVVGHEAPAELSGVGITERLGAELDPSIPFVSDTGESVVIGDYFKRGRPVLLTIIYYECPSLCNYHLNGVVAALKDVNLTPGKDFEIVAVSMNHRETPELAAEKKTSYIEEYGRSESAPGWHFLTGTEENIRKLADQVGFGFKWSEKQQQYAHAAAAYVVTPDGVVSRYLYGIEFKPQTLRLALLEAGQGKIGNIVDQIVLFCFQFNPAKNKYTLYAWNIMRLGAIFAMIGLAIFLVPAWLRERQGTKAS